MPEWLVCVKLLTWGVKTLKPLYGYGNIHRLTFAYEVSQDYHMQRSVTTPRTTQRWCPTHRLGSPCPSNSLSYILFKLGRVPARMPLAIQDHFRVLLRKSPTLNLWLVISPRESCVMQPTRTSFFKIYHLLISSDLGLPKLQVHTVVVKSLSIATGFRVAVGLPLGISLCKPHKCHQWGVEVDHLALHGLSWKKSQGRHPRHYTCLAALLFVSKLSPLVLHSRHVCCCSQKPSFILWCVARKSWREW